MKKGQFYKQLAFLTLALGALVAGLHQIPALAASSSFSLAAIGGFVILSILMFEVGKKSALDKNRNLFTSVVIAFIFAKLLISVVMVVVYSKIFKPESKVFVLPFFIIYLAYTIFETAFMMRLSKSA